MMLRLFLVVVSCALIRPGAAFADTYREFRDWFAYCNNSLKCTLQANVSGEGLYAFGIERGPAASAGIRLFTGSSAPLRPGSSLSITVHGEGGGRFVFPVTGSVRDNGTTRFSFPQKALELLEAMMAGSTMRLEVETGKGRQSLDVSLSGVTAGALFLDDMQQRIGNRDALKERGEGTPMDAKTRATDLSSLAELPAPVVNFWKNNTGGCAETYDDDTGDLVQRLGAVRIRLGGNSELYLMPCGLPGAYNFPQAVLMHDPESGSVRQLSLPVMGNLGPTVTDNPFNLNWDDRTSTLSAFFKGRGLGDCGSRMKWVLDGKAYHSNFELREARVKGECDGNYDNWPQVWPPQ